MKFKTAVEVEWLNARGDDAPENVIAALVSKDILDYIQKGIESGEITPANRHPKIVWAKTHFECSKALNVEDYARPKYQPKETDREEV